jgi:hypothetical protein
MAIVNDSQREKVYRAEHVWENHLDQDYDINILWERVTLEDAQGIADLMVDHFEVRPVHIKFNGRVKRYAGVHRWNEIVFSDQAPHLRVVLHEIAHHIAKELHPYDGGHGPMFRQELVNVVRIWLGDVAADLLQDVFDERGLYTGIEEQKARATASKRREDANYDRDGEIRQAYAIRSFKHQGFLLSYDKRHWVADCTRVKVMMRRSTAEKWVERRPKDGEVVEIKVKFVGPDGDGWGRRNYWEVLKVQDIDF